MALCSPSCLGLLEWTECCKQNSRFASIVTDEEAEKLSAGYTPKNTEKTNKWAIDNYVEWRKWRNENCPQDPAPSCIELLSSGDTRLLNKWLSRYAVETRGGKDLSIHQLQYTVCWVVCSAICFHSTLPLPSFLIRRTRCSKNCTELWTIFSVAYTRTGLDGK